MSKKNRAKNAKDYAKAFKDLADLIEKYAERILKLTEDQVIKLKNRFYGKSIAIIGPRMAGKTTFVNILKDPNLEVDPMHYSPTQEIRENKDFVINYNWNCYKKMDSKLRQIMQPVLVVGLSNLAFPPACGTPA